MLALLQFIPVTAKETSEEFHTRTPKTTALMGLFLFEQLKARSEALILAVFSRINGWVTETRVGFNRLRAMDINKVGKQPGTPLIASICKIIISAGSVSLSHVLL